MIRDVVATLAVRGSGGRVERPTRPSQLGRATVVIPCYNYGQFLHGAVAAAFDQPGLDVDVVIVDDASPDGSGEIADRIAAADPRVRVLRHAVNRGHIATYNDGLALAGGDWVALVSADDLLTPGSLARAAALMSTHPEVGFVYGRARHFSGEPPHPDLGLRAWVTWRGADWLAARCRSGNNVIASPEVVMRGSVLRELGGYRSDLPHSGDLEMWMRAAAIADVGYLVGPDQALYRQHGANMHNAVFRVHDRQAGAVDLSHRWAAFRAVLQGPARALATARSLDATARRTLAGEAMDRAAAARADGLDAVAREYDDLAHEIGGPHVPAASSSRRLVRRVAGRLTGSVRWWRLNQVGV